MIYSDCFTKSGIAMRIKKGFTLIELICVLGILSILFALLLPAVQIVRESARSLMCKDRLRQIGIACQSFESTTGKLPSGTLGFEGRYGVSGSNIETSVWYDSSSPWFWKNSQHTSGLLLILPYFEQQNLHDSLPSISHNGLVLYKEFRISNPSYPEWIGDVDSIRDGSRRVLESFLCPSDNLVDDHASGAVALVTTQPAINTDTMDDVLAAEPLLWQLEQPAPTNYLGCVGAHSGGRHLNGPRQGFFGAMESRKGKSVTHIVDGGSNTFLYGENIGAISARQRTLFHSWCFGGLARGRGGLPWGQDVWEAEPEYLIFGDSDYSYPVGFGSRHPTVVNFVFADGSAHSISRMISIEAIYALSGAADGKIVKDADY